MGQSKYILKVNKSVVENMDFHTYRHLFNYDEATRRAVVSRTIDMVADIGTAVEKGTSNVMPDEGNDNIVVVQMERFTIIVFVQGWNPLAPWVRNGKIIKKNVLPFAKAVKQDPKLEINRTFTVGTTNGFTVNKGKETLLNIVVHDRAPLRDNSLTGYSERQAERKRL